MRDASNQALTTARHTPSGATLAGVAASELRSPPPNHALSTSGRALR